jgi:hypothetical protein
MDRPSVDRRGGRKPVRLAAFPVTSSRRMRRPAACRQSLSCSRIDASDRSEAREKGTFHELPLCLRRDPTTDYLIARKQAGSPEGEAFAARLEAMAPAEAAAAIADMFCLCADEDLEFDICCDLQLDRYKAAAIAAEIGNLRGTPPKRTRPPNPCRDTILEMTQKKSHGVSLPNLT